MDKAAISPEEFNAFQIFLERVTGIRLAAGKEYLVTSRLGELMRINGLRTVGDLLAELQSASWSGLQDKVVAAMTTNETFWFRDISHYQMLTHDLFPQYASSNSPRLSIWSAACSSGQEPYNISMMVHEYQFRNPGKLLPASSIVATDISPEILAEARRGVYCGMATTRGLSSDQQCRYFTPRGECLEVRDEIKKRVTFRELNLINEFSQIGRFDIIFCRNVLIYFSSDMKSRIISRLADALNPGGYLFIGSTESLSPHSDRFEMIKGHGGIAYRIRNS